MSQEQDFHEIRFPVDVSFGSSGGPQRNTQIVAMASGREHRNQRWADARRRYEAGYGVKDLDSLHEVISFFEARRGPLHGFRFRDPVDWKSCAPLAQVDPQDQIIGTGDGTTATFQLVKTYGSGGYASPRPVSKPVSGSVRVAVDGAEAQVGTHFNVDHASGEITFEPGHIPAASATISAGFEFDVPVRFASDGLSISIAAFTAGDIPSIPLLEIRP